MAQTNFNFKTAWIEVEALINENLPKSAEKALENIYTEAKAKNEQAQLIKVLIYRTSLAQQVEEDSWKSNINSFEKEITTAKEPAKQILNSFCASLYQNYYNRKRWQIHNRTNTQNYVKNDPETWTTEDFHKKIAAYYLASLQNEQLLQQTLLDKYDALIISGNQRKLRPTLYDLLVQKALYYFETDEQYITQPSYKFQLADADALADAQIFAKHNYQSIDSNSNAFATIKIYQQLIAFRLKANNTDALIDADIERLKYAYAHSIHTKKDELYVQALNNIYNTYTNSPQAAMAGYLLASYWKQMGEKYDPATGSNEQKYAIKKAAEMATEISKRFHESEGGNNAFNMLNEINSQKLNLELEKVNSIGIAFRALVKYTNVKGIYIKLIPYTKTIDDRLKNNSNYEENKFWNTILSESEIKKWEQALPVIDDYRQHSTEIKVDGLPTGKYILVISKKADFSLNENALAATTFYVSNISFINNNKQYFVLDRETGQPLENAAVKTWESVYNYNTRNYQPKQIANQLTDKNGAFILPKGTKNNSNNIHLEINYKADNLHLEDEIYNYTYAHEPTKAATELGNAVYSIFLDRSIYRPGQTVYFKAIGITQKPNESLSSLFLTNTPITVLLRNANSQTINSIVLTPNEFGSISGSFKLPASGQLNGNFSLMVDVPKRSRQYFSVEEYKRPKFFVEFHKPKGDHKLNDTINITGNAKAFAGNHIDGAKVAYSVKRNTRYIYPWLFWRSGRMSWPPYSNNSVQITTGEATTNADGNFTIPFIAIPDLSKDESLNPVFDYTITADITDINGETRSSTTIVSVGYNPLQLNISAVGGIHQTTESIKKIQIQSTNLANEPLYVPVTVTIHRLQTPDRLIRKRYWETPDTSVMSYKDFIANFPNDEYKNETDYRSWKKAELIQQDTFTTTANTALTLAKPLSAGWYVLEVTTTSKQGKLTKAISYVSVTDVANNKMPSLSYLFSQPINETVEPGEQASFMLGSNAKNLYIINEIIGKKTDSVNKSNISFITNTTACNTYFFPATEANRGGYTVAHTFVKNNRIYTNNWFVNIPWTNKELKIDFETFRDKLLPGQQEKWTLKISGHKGEAVAAEMLAGMYDESLDQFKPHKWANLINWPNYNYGNNWKADENFSMENGVLKHHYSSYKSFSKRYDEFININGDDDVVIIGYSGNKAERSDAYSMDAASDMVKETMSATRTMFAPPAIVADKKLKDTDTTTEPTKAPQINNNNVQIRKDFNETAFFFPDLRTNKQGEIILCFTMPETLTQWKLQTLAHTKDMQTAIAIKNVVTQKTLMVQPNAPRFFRQNDTINFLTKVVNLSNKAMNANIILQMINTATGEIVDSLFQNNKAVQTALLPAGKSIAISFPLQIPMNYSDAVSYRIIAKTDSLSDGEEMAIPVLTNRMLVTESLPIYLRNQNTKTYTWPKLLQSTNSTSLLNHSLTVEYSSNPIWYAVQSLPYLMEYPYECAEQTWNRFFANALATKIVNNFPKIQSVFNLWKTIDTAALLSNLQKNEELKAVLLQETPWVLQAKTESEQKKNIALLFDMVRISNETEKAIGKLKNMQSSNGGFVWFKGGPDDMYITMYILTGIGHLQKLNALPAVQTNTLNKIIQAAIPYLDARIRDEYNNLIKRRLKSTGNNLSYTAIQYLYMRSFFSSIPIPQSSKEAVTYFTTQAKKYWTIQSKYQQAMIALALFRQNDAVTPKAIIKSLTENSITSPEFGMYWKELNTGGYYWWQAPIEIQSLLIEAYAEIENNASRINDLKTWLLKQKQTQNWKTTKATAEACYALLLQGTNWLAQQNTVSITLGNTTIKPSNTEAGTGYFKEKIDGKNIKPDMGNITITQKSGSIEESNTNSSSWGAIYWQYFENLDKITTAATPLQLSKQLFLNTTTAKGAILTPITNSTTVAVGNKVKVRIELRSDRDMEYIHLKDMRAACFEPVNVLSQYKYQDGLGYYQATSDAATNFFFSYLPKGTYVFEYDLVVTNQGNFSNGISSIQCMYAPEFTSHSNGIRIQVNK